MAGMLGQALWNSLAETSEDTRVEILRQMEGVLKDNASAQDWRVLFHSYNEFFEH
jgi:hypothetical protein